jgi:hypothetical protein
MERERWAELSQSICEVELRWQEPSRYTHRTALIVRVHLWSVLHDRPTYWACEGQHWDRHTRPAVLPDQSTMSRRLRTASFKGFMTALEKRLGGKASESLLKKIDGKPLTVAAHSKDPHAGFGRGAGAMGKGYKLHTIWSDRPMPEKWSILPMNVCEKRVGRRLMQGLGGCGYLLGDSFYDTNTLHECAASAGHQLIAARKKSDRGKGTGKKKQSPGRLRSLDVTEPPAKIAELGRFGRGLQQSRKQIERDFANLTSFGGGLTCLPPWSRTLHRVRNWVHAKLLINAVRIRQLRRRKATGAA